MAFGKYKDLNKSTQSNNAFRGKAFEIESNQKHEGYQRWLASMLCNLFDKKFASLSDKSAKGSGIKSMSDQQFSDELHQLIIRNF